MDNRTLEEVRNNETRLINEIKELENINNKLSSALISAEEKNKKYKEVIDRVILCAYKYAQIDGSHHKMWTIDQMVRILLGTEYEKFIKEYEGDGEYEWDIGIAP